MKVCIIYFSVSCISPYAQPKIMHPPELLHLDVHKYSVSIWEHVPIDFKSFGFER